MLPAVELVLFLKKYKNKSDDRKEKKANLLNKDVIALSCPQLRPRNHNNNNTDMILARFDWVDFMEKHF